MRNPIRFIIACLCGVLLVLLGLWTANAVYIAAAKHFQNSLHTAVYEAEQAIREQAYQEGYVRAQAEAAAEVAYAKTLAQQSLNLVDEMKRVLDDTLWAAQCDAAMEEKLKLEGGG